MPPSRKVVSQRCCAPVQLTISSPHKGRHVTNQMQTRLCHDLNHRLTERNRHAMSRCRAGSHEVVVRVRPGAGRTAGPHIDAGRIITPNLAGRVSWAPDISITSELSDDSPPSLCHELLLHVIRLHLLSRASVFVLVSTLPRPYNSRLIACQNLNARLAGAAFMGIPRL